MLHYIKTAKQTDAEKKPSSMNGRIILNNPPLPDKQKQPPIIIAPQFVMHKAHHHARMKVKQRYPVLPPSMYTLYSIIFQF